MLTKEEEEELKQLKDEVLAEKETQKRGLTKEEEEELKQLKREVEEEKKKTDKSTSDSFINKASEAIGDTASEGIRQAGRLGRAGVRGITSALDLPTTIAKMLPESVTNVIGLNAQAKINSQKTLSDLIVSENKPSAKSITDVATDFIDDITDNKLRPRGKTEEYVDVVSETLLPLLLTGGSSAATKTTQVSKKALDWANKVLNFGAKANVGTMASAAGAAAASKYSIDSDLERGQDPKAWKAIAASLLGGAAPGVSASTAKAILTPRNTAAKITGRVTGFKPAEYAKQQELGLPSSLGSTGSGVAKKIEDIAAHIPGSQGKIENFRDKMTSSLAKKLGAKHPDDLIASDKFQPYHLAKEGAKATKDKISQNWKDAEKIYKSFIDRAIDQEMKLNVKDFITEALEKRRGLTKPAELADFGKTPHGMFLEKILEYAGGLTQKEQKILSEKGFTPEIINKIASGMKDDTNVSFAGMKQIIKQVQSKKNEAVRGSPEHADFTAINKNLRNAEDNFIEANALPHEAKALREQKAKYADYASRDQSNRKFYVEDLLGTDIDVNAFNKLLKNHKYTYAAFQHLPKQKQLELTQGLITKMASRAGEFNLNVAHTNWNTKTQIHKKEILNPYTPKQKEEFNKVMDYIGENKKDIEKYANTSRTAHTSNLYSYMIKGGKAIGALASLNIIPALGLVGGYLAARGLGHLWTDPTFISRVNKVITSQNPKQRYNWSKLALQYAAAQKQLNEPKNTPSLKRK